VKVKPKDFIPISRFSEQRLTVFQMRVPYGRKESPKDYLQSQYDSGGPLCMNTLS
jgi:hypothetical protein